MLLIYDNLFAEVTHDYKLRCSFVFLGLADPGGGGEFWHLESGRPVQKSFDFLYGGGVCLP